MIPHQTLRPEELRRRWLETQNFQEFVDQYRILVGDIGPLHNSRAPWPRLNGTPLHWRIQQGGGQPATPLGVDDFFISYSTIGLKYATLRK